MKSKSSNMPSQTTADNESELDLLLDDAIEIGSFGSELADLDLETKLQLKTLILERRFATESVKGLEKLLSPFRQFIMRVDDGFCQKGLREKGAAVHADLHLELISELKPKSRTVKMEEFLDYVDGAEKRHCGLYLTRDSLEDYVRLGIRQRLRKGKIILDVRKSNEDNLEFAEKHLEDAKSYDREAFSIKHEKQHNENMNNANRSYEELKRQKKAESSWDE
jgi:hypothetical protein